MYLFMFKVGNFRILTISQFLLLNFSALHFISILFVLLPPPLLLNVSEGMEHIFKKSMNKKIQFFLLVYATVNLIFLYVHSHTRTHTHTFQIALLFSMIPYG